MHATDLAILAAAVRYFDEEFRPAGEDAIALELPGLGIKPSDLANLRRRISRVQIRYADPVHLHAESAEHLMPVLVELASASESVE